MSSRTRPPWHEPCTRSRAMDAEQHRDLRNVIDAAALLARDLEGYLDAAERGPAGPEARAAARRTAHEADELRAQLEERRHAAGG